MRAKLPSRPKRTTTHFMSRSVTPVPVSPQPIRQSCFRSSSRPTIQSPQEGRHRLGAGHLQAHHRDAWRTDLGRVAARPRLDIHFHAPSRRRAAGRSRMSKRILVVEDQPDNRQIIRDMLARTDYEITEAENGEEALSAIAKQRPDLILMDIQLPIMDGYTAVSRIKADPALRSIPIIAVTSYAL